MMVAAILTMSVLLPGGRWFAQLYVLHLTVIGAMLYLPRSFLSCRKLHCLLFNYVLTRRDSLTSSSQALRVVYLLTERFLCV
ncbi:transposase [Salmonella enterica subsp. enterica serovar Poona]|nr:transposase [Salmonella enterica subsp. enterica serovar Poona]